MGGKEKGTEGKVGKLPFIFCLISVLAENLMQAI